MKKFEDFNLKPTTMEFLKLNGFETPTPIQEEIIPSALRGKDVIGLSKTGTGKTHAFLIPVMEKVDSSLDRVQAVITAPTRELATQIYDKAKMMQEVDSNLIVRLYVGGTDRDKSIERLEDSQPHIVIGTPGRIKDLFLGASALRLDLADTLVIDEADMTLEFGFLDEIDAFAGRMGDDLQMMAFSATMPEQLKPFINKYMHHPLTFRIGSDERFNPDIKHVLVPCYHHSYAKTILSILPGFQPYVCLIFANTRETASTIAESLRKEGMNVTELHGGLESRKRKQAMKEIALATNQYVVCTDLAARGIDLETITHVISCGFPQDLEYYIHRSGRTGRGGSDGICYALYKEEDYRSIRSLQRTGIQFEHKRFKNGEWVSLRPFGAKAKSNDPEMAKEISKLNTKKKTKVKPGYKKKRQKEIERLKQKKKREFIRSKIKEEKKARYKEAARKKKNGEWI